MQQPNELLILASVVGLVLILIFLAFRWLVAAPKITERQLNKRLEEVVEKLEQQIRDSDAASAKQFTSLARRLEPLEGFGNLRDLTERVNAQVRRFDSDLEAARDSLDVTLKTFNDQVSGVHDRLEGIDRKIAEFEQIRGDKVDALDRRIAELRKGVHLEEQEQRRIANQSLDVRLDISGLEPSMLARATNERAKFLAAHGYEYTVYFLTEPEDEDNEDAEEMTFAVYRFADRRHAYHFEQMFG